MGDVNSKPMEGGNTTTHTNRNNNNNNNSSTSSANTSNNSNNASNNARSRNRQSRSKTSNTSKASAARTPEEKEKLRQKKRKNKMKKMLRISLMIDESDNMPDAETNSMPKPKAAPQPSLNPAPSADARKDRREKILKLSRLRTSGFVDVGQIGTPEDKGQQKDSRKLERSRAMDLKNHLPSSSTLDINVPNSNNNDTSTKQDSATLLQVRPTNEGKSRDQTRPQIGTSKSPRAPRFHSNNTTTKKKSPRKSIKEKHREQLTMSEPPVATQPKATLPRRLAPNRRPSMEEGGAYLVARPPKEAVMNHINNGYLINEDLDEEEEEENFSEEESDEVDWHDSDLDSEEENSTENPQFSTVLNDLRKLSPQELFELSQEMERLHPGFIRNLQQEVTQIYEDKRALGDFDDEDDEDQQQMPMGNEQQGVAEDWNSRFQKSIEDLKLHGKISSERLRIYSELSNLAQDFIHCAKTYGSIIITEVQTPYHLKTIKPASVGGFAGGEKYIVNNIMFKFAVDSKNIFNSDKAAMKVAGHELKGLISYFNLGIRGLHFPLMALVDYLGFRLTALSVLPISKDSIVYGSHDAAYHVHASSQRLNNKMRLAAQMLNLKRHKVGLTMENSKVLYSAGDLEGHEVDGKFYLLDFSRAFPPATFDPRYKLSFLYKLLRPEFVRQNPTALCSDAYSGFVELHNPEEHMREVDQATQRLLTKAIPEVAKEINESTEEERKALADQVQETLHAAGINLRYLGILRKYIDKEDFRHVVLVEMIARVIKHSLRAMWRDKMNASKLPLEHEFREMSIDYCNLVFGNSPESTNYWNGKLKEDLEENFEEALEDREKERIRKAVEQKSGDGLKSMLRAEDFCLLFRRVLKMTHLQFTQKAADEFSINPKAFNWQTPFDLTDLLELGVHVRHMNIVALAQGYVLKSKARKKGGVENSTRLCKMAIEKFTEALSDNPGDKRALRELADAADMLGETEIADKYYIKAIEADKHDANTTFKYAVFLENQKRFASAEEHYLNTLERNPAHDHCLQRYADFLESQGNFDSAEEFYIRAAECRQLAKNQMMKAEQNIEAGSVIIGATRQDAANSDFLFL